MLQLQSAFGVVALLALAWAFGENRRAVSLRQAAIGLLRHPAHRRRADQIARAWRMPSAPSTTRSARSHRPRAPALRFVFGYLGGGALPFDLKSPGDGIHPGVSGAARRARDERADHAVVLLADPAAGGARHGLGCWNARSGSAARSGSPPPPTSFSAWSKRRCSSALIWRN